MEEWMCHVKAYNAILVAVEKGARLFNM